MTAQPKPYPGEGASAEQIFLLAEEFCKAADKALAIARRGNPLSHAPYRLIAIHAIELYLNALLLIEGAGPRDIRAFHHNLAVRAERLKSGLPLRRRTSTHLIAMTNEREYLISRYGADQMKIVSPINRVQATLDEVRSKVRNQLEKRSAAAAAKSVCPGPVPNHRKPVKSAESPAAEANVRAFREPQIAKA